MQKTNIIALIILAIFICGAGVIMYYSRPVMNIENTPEENSPVREDEEEINDDSIEEDEEEETGDDTSPELEDGKGEEAIQVIPEASGTYTSTEIATHAVETDCWASVDENVYDLTSWVSRHPGGSKAIISLCGTDATARFEGKHGGSSAAKAALTLLKIGTLSK